MICKKVNNMIQPSQNFQFILGDFMEMMKHQIFYSEYPFTEYSIKEYAPVRFCCELPFQGKGSSPFFFSCLKRLKKLSTTYNGHRRRLWGDSPGTHPPIIRMGEGRVFATPNNLMRIF